MLSRPPFNFLILIFDVHFVRRRAIIRMICTAWFEDLSLAICRRCTFGSFSCRLTCAIFSKLIRQVRGCRQVAQRKTDCRGKEGLSRLPTHCESRNSITGALNSEHCCWPSPPSCMKNAQLRPIHSLYVVTQLYQVRSKMRNGFCGAQWHNGFTVKLDTQLGAQTLGKDGHPWALHKA
jgi:hypothetical protein